MKTLKLLSFITFCVSTSFAQTLYVPGGTVGNNSTNSNVGIGTGSTAPAFKLDIKGYDIFLNSANNSSLHLRTDGNGNAFVNNMNNFHSNASTGNGSLTFTGQTMLRFNIGNAGTSGTERMRISESGLLEVTGQDVNFYSNTLTNTLSVGRSANERFVLQATDSHGFLDYVQDEDANTSHIFYIRNQAAGTSPDNDIRFRTGASDRMTIKSDGRIGIGTISPGAAFEVINSNLSTGVPVFVLNHTSGSYSSYPDQNHPITIRRGTSDNEALSLFLQDNKSHFVYKNDEKSSSIDFRLINTDTETRGGAQASDNVVMTLAGNQNGVFVGIGTTDPDASLTVKGTIHTHEVRVDTDPRVVPDYVFEKDYNLLPLSEVEAYVNQNKHLPEVPSAKEMEENGLNLKEMNLLLLKKVEELTLHLIEMKKENEMQQRQIDELNNSK